MSCWNSDRFQHPRKGEKGVTSRMMLALGLDNQREDRGSVTKEHILFAVLL